MSLSGGIEVGPRGAPLGCRAAQTWIDGDMPHANQINHETAFADRKAPEVVSAAAHRNFQLVILGKSDGSCHILGAAAPNAQCRMAVNGTVPNRARTVVLLVRLAENLAGDLRPERFEVAIDQLGHRN